MTHYMQLLGTDTPNSYGGCCYYGPVDHPAFQSTSAHSPSPEPSATTAGTSSPSPSSPPSRCHVFDAYCERPHTQTAWSSTGATGSEGYLFFNCPEGVQRFSSEANIKLGRVKGFLFTRFASAAPLSAPRASAPPSGTPSVPLTSATRFAATRSMGAASAVMGLPGLLFTINDAGVQCAALFGPSSCWHAQAAVPGRSPRHARLSSHTGEVGVAPMTARQDARTVSPSGLERFVLALRKHYFTHRPMRFRLLCPTLFAETHADLSGEAQGRVSPPEEEQSARVPRDGNNSNDNSDDVRTLVCTSRTAEYASTLPNLYGQDEIFPIARPVDAGDEEHEIPFIVSVMQLSAHSLLVAFRVSGEKREEATMAQNTADAAQEAEATTTRGGFAWCDTSDLVLGYAVVHAPAPAFDAQKARALGVRPGKKFGQLKDGVAVLADVDEDLTAPSGKKPRAHAQCTRGEPPVKQPRNDTATTGPSVVRTPPAAAPASVPTMTDKEEPTATTPAPQAGSMETPSSSEPTPRWVQPWQVMRHTVASRCLYLSLVLDGDHPRDVQQAVHRLLSHELEVVLARWWPQFFAHHGEVAEGADHHHAHQPVSAASETSDARTLVLRHVIHVQPQSYFTGFAAWQREKAVPTDLRAGDMFTAYSHFLFDPFVAPCTSASRPTSLRLSVSASLFAQCHRPHNHGADTASPFVTHHAFTADVSARYTAYPTALAHRYHLHLLAPFLFPMPADAATLWKDATTHAATADGMASDTRTDAPPLTATGAGSDRGSDNSGDVWPYSCKLRCIPEEDLRDWEGEVAPAGQTPPKTSATSAAAAARKASTKAASAASRATAEDFSNNGAGLLRYPTPRSAVALLTEAFRRQEAEALRPLQARWSWSAPTSGLTSSSTTAAAGEEEQGALVFLGTGSAVPSKHRNVSGTYLELHLPPYCFGRPPNFGQHTAVAPGDSLAPLVRGIVILDFGEGSSGQLSSLLQHHQRQRLGELTSSVTREDDPEDGVLEQFIRDVVLIFISHAHADHHLGLTALLSLRHYYARCQHGAQGVSAEDMGADGGGGFRGGARPLLVVCPREVFEYVMDTWGCEAPYRAWLAQEVVFDCMPSATWTRTPAASPGEPALNLRDHLVADHSAGTPGLKVPACLPRLSALLATWNAAIDAAVNGHRDSPEAPPSSVPLPWWDADVFTVDHPANAHALLLRFPTITHTARRAQLTSSVFLFSGDTRPCRELVVRSEAFCRHATGEHVRICLHEATFGPGFESEAIRKKHSTLPEALRVGRDWLHAQSIVLNHFSQRYPKLPGLTDAHLGGVNVDLLCRRRGIAGNQDRDDGAVEGTASSARAGDDEKKRQAEGHRDVAGGREATITAAVPPLVSGALPEACEPKADVQAGDDMCFAFDLMRLPFSAMASGIPAALTPSFVRLLEEYESWGSGTTQRLRE